VKNPVSKFAFRNANLHRYTTVVSKEVIEISTVADATFAAMESFDSAAETATYNFKEESKDESKPLTPTPADEIRAPKKKAERKAEMEEAAKRVAAEAKTQQTSEERKARLLTRLERSESLEVVAEVAADKVGRCTLNQVDP
jgi:DNA-binding SARP family transcriptional activator